MGKLIHTANRKSSICTTVDDLEQLVKVIPFQHFIARRYISLR